jgi:hypothetical protein
MVLRFKKTEDADVIFLAENLAALRQMNTTSYVNHTRAYVKTHGEYVFRQSSSLIDDALNVVEPNIGGGRWIKVGDVNENNQILKILETAATVGGTASGNYLALTPTADQVVNQGLFDLTINNDISGGYVDSVQKFKMYDHNSVPSIYFETKSVNETHAPVVAYTQNLNGNSFTTTSNIGSAHLTVTTTDSNASVVLSSMKNDRSTRPNKIELLSNSSGDSIRINSEYGHIYAVNNEWEVGGNMLVMYDSNFYVGGRLVDFQNAAQNGYVLTYEASSDSFKFKPSGNGEIEAPATPVITVSHANEYLSGSSWMYYDVIFTIENPPVVQYTINYSVIDSVYNSLQNRSVTVPATSTTFSLVNELKYRDPDMNAIVTYQITSGAYELGTPSSVQVTVPKQAPVSPPPAPTTTVTLSHSNFADYEDSIEFNYKFNITNPPSGLLTVTFNITDSSTGSVYGYQHEITGGTTSQEFVHTWNKKNVDATYTYELTSTSNYNVGTPSSFSVTATALQN